jgi:protein-L-isoaspartate(D-aspartate) O-methyltransferase
MGVVHQHLDRLVDELKDGGRIRTALVERAFRTVERHRFLREFSRWDPATSRPVPVQFDPARPSEEVLRVIYSDQALGTRFRDGLPSSSSSQPSVMADMLEALELEPGMRVMEIGTGTGYNAALLAEIVGSRGSVVTEDIDPGSAAEAEEALGAIEYGSPSGSWRAMGRRVYQRMRRSIGSWSRWDAPISPSGGMSSSPRRAGWWCRSSTPGSTP